MQETSEAPAGAAGAAGPRPASATVAAAASAGAALVHAAAAGTHAGDDVLVALFALTAGAQLAVAGLLVGWRHRAGAALAALVNGGAVLAWLASRTVGLPFVDSLAGVEAVGRQDAAAAVLGALAAGAAAVAASTPAGARRPARNPSLAAALAGLAVLALAVPGVAAPHAHGDHDDHGHAAGAHDHDDDAPIISLDDPRLTAAQQRAARDLVDRTAAGMARFPDEAAVVAAGYRSIGDGRRPGSFEHFIHPAHSRDGRELDPSAVESIVLQLRPDGTKAVVSAMYILEPGSTMDDVPDIAGGLTTWHDHQNLCWDATGTRLAGVLRDGRCVPGGTFRPTAPMLHVWLVEHPCGPFAGLEGHGADGTCSHAH